MDIRGRRPVALYPFGLMVLARVPEISFTLSAQPVGAMNNGNVRNMLVFVVGVALALFGSDSRGKEIAKPGHERNRATNGRKYNRGRKEKGCAWAQVTNHTGAGVAKKSGRQDN